MFSIRPASLLDLADRLAALEFLFADLSASERPFRISRAITALDEKILDPENVFTGWVGNRVEGILVCEVLPGRTANVWPIRVRSRFEQIEMEDALFSHALQRCRSGGAAFAQSLLPSDDPSGREAARRNGFQRITRVLGMRCELPIPFAPSPIRLRMESGSTADRDRFKQILMSTFDDSLDCPELNGLRTPEEIVEGHLAASPDRARWQLAWTAAEPVGVLILSEGALSEQVDLSYMGVVPAARGRGIGKSMLSASLHQLAVAGAREVTLLVDERNRPAIDLYHTYGFHSVDGREVFLRVGL